MAKVNLDALIPREDFDVEENINLGKKKETISIEDLKIDSFFFSNIRKPDFQRETNEWDKNRISEFIKSFIEGDLIPAIILWRSTGGYLFVIDGSHRLSALSAWVNDDYGDGKVSKLFYDGVISDEQLEIAQETRKLVNKTVGSYDDFKLASTYPDKFKPEVVKYAKNLAALAIQLQWVEGDATKAESSFFKINQQAAPIDKTELKLLESRRKPNSIAARAIIRSGKGHKYWSSFSNETQHQIQEIAKEINEILFAPKLKTPIKTLDIPVGGKLYSSQTLPLILDFINVVNNLDFNNKGINDDLTGEATIQILKKTRKIVYRLNSNHSSSLGLHPVIYFYSKEGRHRTVSLLAVVDFVMELDKRQKINDFIKVREQFEECLIKYDYLIQQIYLKYRSVQKSYKDVSKLFQKLVTNLQTEKAIHNILNEIISSNDFQYLTIRTINQETHSSTQDFNTNKKSEIYIKDALQNAQKCKICQGLIHRNSISIDHIQRKEDGGLASVDNGQITHPYCNTGYKN
ncbi:HNH endonuclease [Nostoc sp. DedQUE07]|uniref:HNH endonuclease n=1 Tax=Nostoc sp. DedQUE07 TaxID=3075392 RepID=UPI002AD361D4|nr:HNH endonuclease [Nostoc sp. DedQUE07]MDZ8131211.1 HNH endonuclease [Nostoc sp. DedQUE07]